jgi:hypothetical protein
MIQTKILMSFNAVKACHENVAVAFFQNRDRVTQANLVDRVGEVLDGRCDNIPTSIGNIDFGYRDRHVHVAARHRETPATNANPATVEAVSGKNLNLRDNFFC